MKWLKIWTEHNGIAIFLAIGEIHYETNAMFCTFLTRRWKEFNGNENEYKLMINAYTQYRPVVNAQWLQKRRTQTKSAPETICESKDSTTIPKPMRDYVDGV